MHVKYESVYPVDWRECLYSKIEEFSFNAPFTLQGYIVSHTMCVQLCVNIFKLSNV